MGKCVIFLSALVYLYSMRLFRRQENVPIVWLLWVTILCSCESADNSHFDTWNMYSGDPTGSKYSSHQQINRDNVQQLKVAWTYETGDARSKPASTIECNPIIVDDRMYVTTPGLKLVALDAATGQEKWSFDPFISMRPRGVNRGVTYYRDASGHRLFFVAGSNLYCVDASSGRPDTTFGESGIVNLYEGLDREVSHLSVTAATPGIIFEDLLIMGTSLGEGPGEAAPGHIRAYDVHTGDLSWIFHTIPHPGEFGYDTWSEGAWEELGGANVWGGFTLDEERGWVFCGTGSSTYDHWGGNRLGDNLFANCILALDARSGDRIWHYQVVHHDIWDYDLPCPPNLVQVKRGVETIDAIAQPTKMGHLFVLNRETGEPIFPIVEQPVPQSRIQGEVTSPTQPFPPTSLRYCDQRFTVDNVTNISVGAARAVQARLDSLDTGDIFLPPSERGAVTLPQFNGGTDWGGAAYDPQTHHLFVNASNEAEWISMVPAKPLAEISKFDFGRRVYQANCSICHGYESPRNPGSPSQEHLRTFVAEQGMEGLDHLLRSGQGQMPSFAYLTEDEKDVISAFLLDQGKDKQVDVKEMNLSYAADKILWVATGHNTFKDPEGFPANRPPWGLLNAIDLNRGEIVWQVPLGTYPELERKGHDPTGTFNMGGPLVTAGGLVFIGATMDERFRAFDKDTGSVLWEYQMDAGGYATPSTYMIGGRQYVVIAAGGGGKPGTRSGGKYFCFAL